jgi:hypothetical protein
MCVLFLSIMGVMPWWGTGIIVSFTAALLGFSWIRRGIPPIWAFFQGVPMHFEFKHRSVEIGQWIQDHNLRDRVYLPDDHPSVIHFRSAKDATLFKLTWGGTN